MPRQVNTFALCRYEGGDIQLESDKRGNAMRSVDPNRLLVIWLSIEKRAWDGRKRTKRTKRKHRPARGPCTNTEQTSCKHCKHWPRGGCCNLHILCQWPGPLPRCRSGFGQRLTQIRFPSRYVLRLPPPGHLRKRRRMFS